MHQAYEPEPANASRTYAVPAYEQQPRFPAMPASPADWRYHPPAAPSWWHRHRRTLRALTLVGLLALCGLTILALVREQTGTQGLLVGLALAVLPVPLLLAAFRWIDGVHPAPWRNHAFAFAWGACAATLIALLANTLTTEWLATSVVTDSATRADTLGATLVAPVVEESAKAVAILLLFLYRHRAGDGVVQGMVIAGITATGFAFTENVLYLGNAFGQDELRSPEGLHDSMTAATFFIRIVVSPFAHPLFTAMIGIGFGIAATVAHRRRVLRRLLPFLGLLTAILLHAIWNGSATSGTPLTFLMVYALFMIPVFAALTWLAIWSRLNDLRIIRRTLPAYAAAGWISPPETWALASMRARSVARGMARRLQGPTAARTVLEYQHFATALALLRARAEQGAPASDFQAREQELLHHVWTRRSVAGPPTERAAHSMARPYFPPPYRLPGPGGPAGPPGGPHQGPYAYPQPHAFPHPHPYPYAQAHPQAQPHPHPHPQPHPHPPAGGPHGNGESPSQAE